MFYSLITAFLVTIKITFLQVSGIRQCIHRYAVQFTTHVFELLYRIQGFCVANSLLQLYCLLQNVRRHNI